VKGLRGFLGLTSYYRKFVKDYGFISRPLTELLKKDGFHWNEKAEQAFEGLKAAMSDVPTLGLPDFNEPFTLEIDASEGEVGAVLMQRGRPLAFISQALAPKHKGLSVYDKELLAMLIAVEKWRHYLEGGSFVIKTDHESLKFLSQQKLHTHLQRRGMSKLMGLDFTIQYRRGYENKAAGALSRCLAKIEEGTVAAITAVTPNWLGEVADSYQQGKWTKELLEQLVLTPGSKPNYTLQNGLLRYKGRLIIGEDGALRRRIIGALHDSPVGGHSGIQNTYYKVKMMFHWPGLRKDIDQYVKGCDVCSRCKHENIHPPGLLQPLPVPDHAWTHISMDFVEGLPKSEGKDCILVVVDRFTKYGHFLGLAHPFTA